MEFTKPATQARRTEVRRAVNLTSEPIEENEGVLNVTQQLESLNVGTVPVHSLSSEAQASTPDQLCSLCNTLFAGDHRQDSEPISMSWRPHHHENDLERSASNGCHLCNMILYALQKNMNPAFLDEISNMAPKSGFGRYIGLGIELSRGQGAIGIIAPKSESSPFVNPVSYVQLSHQLGIVLYWGALGSNNMLRRSLGSPYNQNANPENYSAAMILQMKNWLGNCKDKHEFCKTADKHKIKDRGLPSRLLELIDINGHTTVRLISTGELSKDTSYITLSYRWPINPTIKLTTANKAALQQKINTTDLSTTIQDAIWLAHQLDCQYLWVDALCIIQDSEADWLQESAKMCEYYSHSLLSISASSADSVLGFLKVRNPISIIPCKITPTGGTYDNRPIYVRQTSPMTYGEMDPLEKLPLYQRGWVFQERLLAPRIVHFTDVEVFWECATLLLSDIYPEGVAADPARKRWLSYSGATLNPSPAFDNNIITGHGTLGQFMQRGTPFGPIEVSMWTELIEEYSALNLTFESDKLAAIGGLAKRSHQVASGKLGRYFAGIWEKCLALQLGWKTLPVFPDILLDPRSTTYKAPSWSWASVNCRVTYDRSSRITSDKWFTFLDIRLEQALDAYGPLKSGWLRLRGSLLRVKLTRPDVKNDGSLPQAFPLIDWHFGNFSYHGYDCQVQLDSSPVSEIPKPGGTIVYAFPIASYCHDIFINLQLLLLKPTGKKSGQYTRVGVLRLSHEATEEFVLSCECQPKLESSLYEHYENSFETGVIIAQQYTVEIV